MFCFIGDMETGSVNSNMKNPPLKVGIIVPPDDHFKPVLYSDVKASRDFVILNHDIYQKAKASKNLNEKKTPLSVKIIFGTAAILTSIPLIKKLFR